MTVRLNDNFTIVISAPRGALGRPLAALIHHVCNPSSKKPNFINFAPGQDEFTQAESSAFRYKRINELQIELPYGAGSPQVIASRLSTGLLNTVFSDAIFISISIKDTYRPQLGYNILREEMTHDQTLMAVDTALSEVERMMFNKSYDWAEELQDPLHMDKPHVQLLCAYLGRNYTMIDVIGDETAPVDPEKLLELTYEEISTRGQPALGTLKLKLFNFLQDWAQFNPDIFESAWSNYIQALNKFHSFDS